MQNFLHNISITNFKSIRSCEINELKRINLFIGRPNVGKSNIIEALSLFSIPYLRENQSKKISDLIRAESESELFYNGNTGTDGTILVNGQDACNLSYDPKTGLELYFRLTNNEQPGNPSLISYAINEKLVIKGKAKELDIEPSIKRYTYKSDVTYKKSHARYLIPPFGPNLLTIIETYGELREQIAGLFQEYNLKIAFDKSSQSIKVIQAEDKNTLFLIPYTSIADTLQRIIFHKAAIASNVNSILLFEEPEAHSFPPYMTHLTQDMINKRDNQYFIATHSPFILNDLLENSLSELSVFVVYYEHFETKVKQLTPDELHNIFQNGVDLFTNNESFV